MKSILNPLLALISSGIILLLSEVIIRQFVPMGTMHYTTPNGLRWNSVDSKFKYVLTPGYEGELKSTEFEVPIKINSLGFRDDELETSKKTKKHKVFVIGDSFVFGVGATYERALPQQIESFLNTKSKIPYSVWNLGVPSYSTQQYALMLDKYFKYDPKIVILCLTLGKLPSGANDLFGAVDFQNWQKQDKTQNSGTVSQKAPEEKISLKRNLYQLKKWFSRNSALYNYLLIIGGQKIRALTHSQTQLNEKNQKKFDEGWKILEGTLKKIKKKIDRSNGQLRVVYIPTKPDLDANYSEISVRLNQLTKNLNITLIDLWESFIKRDSQGYYYPLDGHFTAKGNRVAAKQIVESL